MLIPGSSWSGTLLLQSLMILVADPGVCITVVSQYLGCGGCHDLLEFPQHTLSLVVHAVVSVLQLSIGKLMLSIVLLMLGQ